MANAEISDGRKTVYYIGLAMLVGGVLTCVISFGSLIGGCGQRELLGERVSLPLPGGGRIEQFDRRGGAPLGFLSFFAGMVLSAAGGVTMGCARRGIAGSGLVLNPQAAREDLKPWTKMAGGMVQDALEETSLTHGTAMDFDSALRKLHQLRQDGILTETEYQTQKQAILKKLTD